MARRLIVEIVGDASSFQRSLTGAAAATDGFGAKMSAVGDRITSVGKSMTTHLTLPIVGIGAVATKAAIDFQNSMELIHTQAGVSQKAVDSMSKSVLAMAGSVATAPDELSAGLYHLTSQGLRGKEALDALRSSAEGAKMGQADLEDVTNAMGAAISSNIKGVGDYNRVMGIFNSTVGAGDMRMEDLAQALGTGVLTQAKQAGVGIKDVSAALAVFGDNNIRGAKAGTLVSSALRLMSSPSKTAAKALDSYGISAQTLSNTLQSGGLVPAIKYLKDRLDALGPSSFKAKEALTQGFGGRQSMGVRTLVDEFSRLEKKEKDVAKGGASFASDWQAYTKTTAYHLASMGAQMQATGVTIGDILLPIVSRIANVIGELGAKFDALSPHTRKLIEIFAGVIAVLGPIVGVVGTIATAVGGLSTAFMGLAGILGPVAAALAAPAAAIAAVVVAVAALAAGIAAAVLFPKQFEDVLEHMGMSAQTAGEVVRGLQDVFAVVRDAVEALMPVFETVWQTIVATVKNEFEVIKGIFDVFDGLIHGDWSQVWQGIKDIVSGTFGEIGTLLRGAINILGDLAELIGTAIWKGIVEPIAKLAEAAFQWIHKELSAAIHEAASWVVGAAEDIGKSLVDGAISGMERAAGDVGGFFGHLLHKAVDAGKSAIGAHSPSTLTRDEIGIPMAQGVIAGYLLGVSPLTGKISTSVHQALEQAKTTIEQYRGKLTTTWSTLVSDANTALAGIGKSKGTPAGGLLAGLTATYNAAQFKDQLSQAQSSLSSALQTAAAGTTDDNGNAVKQPQQVAAAFQTMQSALTNVTAAIAKYGVASKQAVAAQKELITSTSAAQTAVSGEQAGPQQSNDQAAVSAQQGLNDLYYQQMQATLTKQAALQKTQDAARLSEKKKNLDDALKQLLQNFETERMSHAQEQSAIISLLKSYGISYTASGKALGEAFANGLRAAMSDAEKAAQDLAAAVSKYLPHSPAEKGPLSKPIGWGSYLMTGLAGSAAAASAALASGLAAPSPAFAGGAGRGGAQVTIQVNVPQGFVGNAQELGDAIAVAVTRSAVGGHPLWREVVRQATS